MQGTIDLLKSERGVFCLLVLAAVTVLAFVGRITGDQWIEFVKYLVGALVASKTVTTAMDSWTAKQPQVPTAIARDRPNA